MRISFLTRNLMRGGAERQLVALAKELHRRGHSVNVIVFYPGNGSGRGLHLEEELHEAGVPVRSLDKKNRWDVVGPLLRLIKCLRQEKTGILHSYLVLPNVFAVLLIPIFPRLRIVWGVRASNVDFKQARWHERLLYRLERLLSSSVDLIIVNSRAGRDFAAARGFPKKKDGRYSERHRYRTLPA